MNPAIFDTVSAAVKIRASIAAVKIKASSCGKNQGVAAVKIAVKIKVKVARSQSQQKNRIFTY